MRRGKITLKSVKDVMPAFGNGFLDSAFSAHRKEMEFFDMSFDNESVDTKYDKKLLISK
jgi:hypothetical protein